jgi:hypothetical protein
MKPDKKEAPLGGGANSIKHDLLGSEIRGNYTTNAIARQVRGKFLTDKVNTLKARLPFALDAQAFPILARNWPLVTRQELQQRILSVEGWQT